MRYTAIDNGSLIIIVKKTVCNAHEVNTSNIDIGGAGSHYWPNNIYLLKHYYYYERFSTDGQKNFDVNENEKENDSPKADSRSQLCVCSSETVERYNIGMHR